MRTAGAISPLQLEAGRSWSQWLLPLRTMHPELWIFAGAILALNTHCLGASILPLQVYVPSLVREGEWWRLITHPFVHASWYHLLLDAGAFLLLHAGLEESRARRRLLIVGMAAAGSLAAALAAGPEVERIGFCGLSGIAHGLMAARGLEMLQGGDAGLRLQGAICLGLVALKSAIEAVTGACFLSWLHFGLMGSPIAACHAGGVAGGIAGMLLARRSGRR